MPCHGGMISVSRECSHCDVYAVGPYMDWLRAFGPQWGLWGMLIWGIHYS